MKIIRIVFELDFGGVEKVTELAVKGFQTFAGLNFHVISLEKGGKISENLHKEGHHVLVMNNKAKIPDFLLIYRLSRYFRQEGFDVVHTVGAEANFHGLIAAAMAGVPVRIGEEIGFPKHHIFYRLLFNFTYRFAHKLICVSEAVKQHLHDIGELPLSKAKVIYNPIELPAIKETPHSKEDSFVFITVSRLTAIKNINAVIRALAAIIQETSFRPKLMVIGEGEERDALEALTLELQVDAFVTFTGYQENVFELLHAADVFVLPSFSEGSSLALAEAMHVGLPSIVTKIGGASEILGDSDSGLLIDPKSMEDLKQAMLSFLHLQPSERREMGNRAKKQARRFSVENYCKELLALYSSVSTSKNYT